MKFHFQVKPSSNETAWKIRASDNGRVFFESNNVQEPTPVEYEFDDDVDGEHRIQIEISGKMPGDTIIDQEGNIVKDNLIDLVNFMIDEIEIDQIVNEKAVYRHNFNGTGDFVDDKFYGTAGCNGVITLEFTSPAYIWLLEAM